MHTTLMDICDNTFRQLKVKKPDEEHYLPHMYVVAREDGVVYDSPFVLTYCFTNATLKNVSNIGLLIELVLFKLGRVFGFGKGDLITENSDGRLLAEWFEKIV